MRQPIARKPQVLVNAVDPPRLELGLEIEAQVPRWTEDPPAPDNSGGEICQAAFKRSDALIGGEGRREVLWCGALLRFVQHGR